jgi:predicted metal-binding membrane protein
VLAAGALQFTRWKARHLARCRVPPAAGSAWQRGLRLGLHCGCGCGFTAALLAVGLMDPWAMASATAAIAAERLFPAAGRTAQAIGAGAVIAGLAMLLTL